MVLRTSTGEILRALAIASAFVAGCARATAPVARDAADHARDERSRGSEGTAERPPGAEPCETCGPDVIPDELPDDVSAPDRDDVIEGARDAADDDRGDALWDEPTEVAADADAVADDRDAGSDRPAPCDGGTCGIGWTRLTVSAASMAVGPRGNVYRVGGFGPTAAAPQDFDPGPGVDPRSSPGGHEGFVQELDATGAYVRTALFAGTSSEYSLAASAVAIGPDGEVYVGGDLSSGAADLDPGPATFAASVPPRTPQTYDEQRLWLVRLAPTLSAQWVQSLDAWVNFETGAGVGAVAVDARAQVALVGSTGFSVGWTSGGERRSLWSSDTVVFAAVFSSATGATRWVGGQRSNAWGSRCAPQGAFTAPGDGLAIWGWCHHPFEIEYDLTGRSSDSGPFCEGNEFVTRLTGERTYAGTAHADCDDRGLRRASIRAMAPARGGWLLAGTFNGSADLDPTARVYTPPAELTSGEYVGLYTQDFQRVWTRVSGELPGRGLTALAADDTGTIYLAFWNDGLPALVAQTEAGATLWTRSFPAAVHHIVPRPPYGLYLSGVATTRGDFDPGPGEDIQGPDPAAARPYAPFVTRLTMDGVY